MEDYKPNSHRYKEEQKQKQLEAQAEKKFNKVVSGPVKVKKKSEMSKVKDVFIAEDASKVKSYIVWDVLVPAVKKAVSDIVTNGIDMILYGETGHSRKSSTGSKVSYSRFYDQRGGDDRREVGPRVKTGYAYNDIVYTTRGEAEEVLSLMEEAIDSYGMVSVADMYDMVGETANYTDNKYGWTSLRIAEVVRTRDGYIIKLPKAMPFK